jgi:hypothetical protein
MIKEYKQDNHGPTDDISGFKSRSDQGKLQYLNPKGFKFE